ncbi:hypothetical protein VTK26DRAFT_3914 [Humicola hyalothermophila]
MGMDPPSHHHSHSHSQHVQHHHQHQFHLQQQQQQQQQHYRPDQFPTRSSSRASFHRLHQQDPDRDAAASMAATAMMMAAADPHHHHHHHQHNQQQQHHQYQQDPTAPPSARVMQGVAGRDEVRDEVMRLLASFSEQLGVTNACVSALPVRTGRRGSEVGGGGGGFGVGVS